MNREILLATLFCVLVVAERDCVADNKWPYLPARYEDFTQRASSSASRWNLYQEQTCFSYAPYSGGDKMVDVKFGNLGINPVTGLPRLGHTSTQTLWGVLTRAYTTVNNQAVFYEYGQCTGTVINKPDGSKWFRGSGYWAGEGCPSIFTVLNHEMGHAAGFTTHGGFTTTMGDIMGAYYYPIGGSGYGWGGAEWEIVDIIGSDGAVGRLTGLYHDWCHSKPVFPGSESDSLPGEFSLSAPYPNPFNPATTVAVSLPLSGYLQLRVYNTLGQQVRVLAIGEHGAGRHTFVWNGMDDNGRDVASGVYVIRLELPERAFVSTQQVSLLK